MNGVKRVIEELIQVYLVQRIDDGDVLDVTIEKRDGKNFVLAEARVTFFVVKIFEGGFEESEEERTGIYPVQFEDVGRSRHYSGNNGGLKIIDLQKFPEGQSRIKYDRENDRWRLFTPEAQAAEQAVADEANREILPVAVYIGKERGGASYLKPRRMFAVPVRVSEDRTRWEVAQDGNGTFVLYSENNRGILERHKGYKSSAQGNSVDELKRAYYR